MSKGALSPVASKMVLKCLYLARLARPDILWAVNSLAREVTKWNTAYDKRIHRLISYIHWTENHVMASYVGNEAKDCKLMMFCDASFAGDLRDSKSTSGGILCLVGSQTFAPICWMCKKQGAVSHSSSEAEIIALDACLRLDGLPCLDFWDEVINVLHPETVSQPKEQPTKLRSNPRTREATDVYKVLSEIDRVPTNISKVKRVARMIIMEDNDAVIKMCIKCRSPNMRHVARTHRVDLDWVFER